MIGGDEILEGVDSPGVGGGVAADGTGALAGWIGGEVQARPAGQGGDGFGKLGVSHAGLHMGGAVGDVDLENLVHPRVETITPLLNPTHPPAKPVPEPRGTIWTSYWLKSFTIWTTCSVLVGNTTAEGRALAMVNPSLS